MSAKEPLQVKQARETRPRAFRPAQSSHLAVFAQSLVLTSPNVVRDDVKSRENTPIETSM